MTNGIAAWAAWLLHRDGAALRVSHANPLGSRSKAHGQARSSWRRCGAGLVMEMVAKVDVLVEPLPLRQETEGMFNGAGVPGDDRRRPYSSTSRGAALVDERRWCGR